ncbi:fumarylacetoacetate hydrolase family protein [Allorhizobium taibaishanense]|uniref:Fumarylacetoacetate (FAA) hydrolase n=1 Tax=Allorhizobium taibaishanense TaxID=887144 RepID=A0A1Q9A6W3_9HYPH|nr:fumarylacetoacetate hydrolase family protein [Allorhizobium taibaishanense]MBB4008533.1 fumarylacetoacetate (FAA) hydrolase [Allorhizobium taibaishanense]OLP50311.1 fumarylacetoacetate hydrolase [Allorhizobium taibaishanense]
MKFATYHDGSRDGQLWIVSRDLRSAVPATGIASSLLAAIEDWDSVAPRLAEVYERLNNHTEPFATRFEPERCLAPMPRSPQWLDASAFLNHGDLMDKAFNHPPKPDVKTIPLVYQGASDDFRGPLADVEFPDDAMMIDMEGEFGVILAPVAMGATADKALEQVRLIVQINDWSLRAVGPQEMRSGFGFIQAKPSTSFAPVAITPDELGPHWAEGRVALQLHVEINGRRVGDANGQEMHFSFGQIIAHCVRSRRLSAGTIVGSGTVSNVDRAAGSSCISEIRVIELLDQGQARTPFLTWGDRVRMEARMPDGSTPFGVIDQKVVQA